MYKMCNSPNCKIRPNFNYEGEKKAIYCSTHKIKGMIDIKGKKCIYEGCQTHSLFNFQREIKTLYCSKHKLEGMIDLKSKKCVHEGCQTNSKFNFEGNPQRLYCSKHKLEGMIDIIHKKCNHNGCKTNPYFNYIGQPHGIYCSKHKLENMSNVITKKCKYNGCQLLPSYNFRDKQTRLYCSIHKLNGMINLNKTCIHDGCKRMSSFNFYGIKFGIYCSEHKLDGMVNVTDKHCKTHLCSTIVHDKYEGYCVRCFVNLYPDKPVLRNYKTKEYAVAEYITNKFANFTWIQDKKIQDGCSKKRPDLLLDLGYQILIIEIDENQHNSYENICENKRMMEISQDLGHRPIIFICFNPDDYLYENTSIKSCWTYNKSGICVIEKSKTKEWNDRLCKLENEIKYWSSPENITMKTINVVKLFYDT
jgi:hypothetical protein